MNSENKLWKAWVQRRVEKIRKTVAKDVWQYVKTNGNAVDIGTSEKSLQLPNQNVWRYGAEFLYDNESEWQSQKFIISKVYKIKEKSNGEGILILRVETRELGLGNIIDFNWYGTLQKLLRITVYAKRFVRNYLANVCWSSKHFQHNIFSSSKTKFFVLKASSGTAEVFPTATVKNIHVKLRG